MTADMTPLEREAYATALSFVRNAPNKEECLKDIDWKKERSIDPHFYDMVRQYALDHYIELESKQRIRTQRRWKY